MATCPKCKKQELKTGEELCPYCKNKKSNLLVKITETAVAVVTLVAIIVIGRKGRDT
jgi:uncharacterized Zn finger protein (UPF0148 family)